MSSFVYAQIQEPTILVNGEKIDFDIPPIIEKGRSLVEFRSIFEALDFDISWDEKTSSIYSTKNDVVIILKIGTPVAVVNNKNVVLDVAPKIFKDRTLVPLRFVGEASGKLVDWNQKSNAISIYDYDSNEKKDSSTLLSLVACDINQTYLGKLTTDILDSDSIFNELGTYGSSTSVYSIWNKYGKFGNEYSVYSAFNRHSITPPMIIDYDGNVIGRLTVNKNVTGAISPYEIYDFLKTLGL